MTDSSGMETKAQKPALDTLTFQCVCVHVHACVCVRVRGVCVCVLKTTVRKFSAHMKILAVCTRTYQSLTVLLKSRSPLSATPHLHPAPSSPSEGESSALSAEPAGPAILPSHP